MNSIPAMARLLAVLSKCRKIDLSEILKEALMTVIFLSLTECLRDGMAYGIEIRFDSYLFYPFTHPAQLLDGQMRSRTAGHYSDIHLAICHVAPLCPGA
jgi:hypothetical protein